MAHYADITTSHTSYEDWREIMDKTSPVPIVAVLEAVKEEKWQELRLRMKGTPLCVRHTLLQAWGTLHNWDLRSCIQIRNYITACMRGGLIRKEGE